MANPTSLAPCDPSSKVDLVPQTSGTTAATYTSSAVQCGWASSALIQVTTANLTGSLDVKVQTLLPDGTTWADLAAFTQITTNTTRVLNLVSAGNSEYAKTDGTLTAGTFVNGLIGSALRVKYIVTTGPVDILIAAEFFV